MAIERTSKEEHMTFGNRYGNLAKMPVALNNDGKLRAGSEKIPRIEAVLSAHRFV